MNKQNIYLRLPKISCLDGRTERQKLLRGSNLVRGQTVQGPIPPSVDRFGWSGSSLKYLFEFKIYARMAE